MSQGLFFFRQLVASLSLQMTGLDLRPFPVTILMSKVALGRIFLHSNSVFFCQHHFTNAPYSTLSLYHSYEKDKRSKTGNLQIKQCFVGYRV